ncbi:MAG: hypothetical protein GY832_21900 [Chloroflexi bacterium]|nr:hypothetical protein [Chloroflexota bacterium]
MSALAYKPAVARILGEIEDVRREYVYLRTCTDAVELISQVGDRLCELRHGLWTLLVEAHEKGGE